MNKPRKPKFSHFASPDLMASVIRDDVDRSNLGRLYPSPKTYDEKKRDDVLRQQAFRRRWPKYPPLIIALYGSITGGIFMWFIQSVGRWLFSTNNEAAVMSIVFFSFAVGLAVTGIIIVWVIFVNKQFSHFSGALELFWFISIIAVGIAFAFSLGGWPWEFTNVVWVPSFVLFYFIINFFATRLTLKKD